MHALIFSLLLFAFWSLAHQVFTFSGWSWTLLRSTTAWLALPAVLAAAFLSSRIAQAFMQGAALPTEPAPTLPSHTHNWIFLATLGAIALSASYGLRYTIFLASIAIPLALVARGRAAQNAARFPTTPAAPLPPLRAGLTLALLTATAVLVVLCANRSDFDDAEYIQLAIQTLRNPDRGLFTFDHSLGIVLEQFRFAPYRATSYETLVGLVSESTGLNILDVYYLLVPSVAAALSVLAAFVFLRWFLPQRWALLATLLFVLCMLAWGESSIAYGSRVYVRLFQGKGLLVALTTPATVLLALMWMRQPSLPTGLGLLMMHAASVGASSSGIVITCFAAGIGLAAGLGARPDCAHLRRAVIGGLSLLYPVSLGLWLKYASSATGKVEAIGTPLPIEASLGGSWRMALTMTILSVACFYASRYYGSTVTTPPSSPEAASKKGTFIWLTLFSFLFALNPLLTPYVTQFSAQNMSWRLAWAAPMPLLLALGMAFILKFSKETHDHYGRHALLRNLAALALPILFFGGGTWAISSNNKVSWGWAERKLPPEYEVARRLHENISKLNLARQPLTVLVDARIGTWLTVVAPEYKLIMPGHGYLDTLITIMDPEDFKNRLQLVHNIAPIMAGDKSLDVLFDKYGVDIIVPGTGDSVDPNRFIVR